MLKIKRERSSNFSKHERSLLVQFANEKKSILENKKTDQVTNRMKLECWKSIAKDFNSSNAGPHRDPHTLKAKYENIKKELRKLSACYPLEPSSPPLPEEEKELRDTLLMFGGVLKHPNGTDIDPLAGLPPSNENYYEENGESSTHGSNDELLVDWCNEVPSTIQNMKCELPMIASPASEADLSPHEPTVKPEVLAKTTAMAPRKSSARVHLTGGSSRRWPVLSRRTRKVAPGVNFMNAKLRLSRKKDLLLDLQIEAAKQQIECFTLQKRYYKRQLGIDLN